LCHAGGPHDFTGSAEYSVAVAVRHVEQPEPVVVTGPRLSVTESAEAIDVDGTGFSPGEDIVVSFIQGPKSKVVRVVVDDQGRFHHVEEDVVQDESGGSVIAREEVGGVATARLKTFFPVAPSPPG